jgi:hypothetical protein
MKTLNRPMFRYGGPIKEGVMNGIREPKRNGGSMANNEGPRRAALVGNPIYPEVDGRTNHLAPIPIGMGIAAGARAILPAVVRYGKPLLQGAKRIFGKTTPASVTRGSKLTKAQSIKEFGKGSGRATNVTMNPSKFDPNYLGRDPIIKSIGAVGKGIFSPTSKGVVAKAARFATAPSSIVAGVAYYMWPDGEERTNPPPKKTDGVNTPSGNNPFGYEDDVKTTPEGEKELTLAEKKALEAKARREQMDSYKEIMDIKGMNKDAAYKSLIDASKIIQEGGNLKKQLKDGSLISKVTEAASKNFDKVRGTENALSSLLVKSKIESDLRAEQGGPLMQQAKDLVNAGGAANIKEAMEYLSKKPSIVQTATDYAKKFGKGFVDQDTAILAIQETFKKRATPVITEKLFEEYKKADGYTTVIDLFEKLKGQKKLGEGYYVIGGNGFVVDERGNTKQVL